jgi:hypothetical protein
MRAIIACGAGEATLRGLSPGEVVERATGWNVDLRLRHSQEDGTIIPRPSVKGAVTYTADGHFHFITTATDAPKYASNDPAHPSADEAMATASRSLAYGGTYTVDENTKTIHAEIEFATFPNLVGAPNQRRIITSITADEMKFTNPRTPAGVTLEIVWKRAK